jgi:hypothetical protein
MISCSSPLRVALLAVATAAVAAVAPMLAKSPDY